jgi:hypothetical protein
MTSPRWRASVHHKATGKFLIRLQVKAPDLRSAECHAVSIAGLTLRLGPNELTIPRLNQIA